MAAAAEPEPEESEPEVAEAAEVEAAEEETEEAAGEVMDQDSERLKDWLQNLKPEDFGKFKM